MVPKNRTEIVALILRVILGAWFVYSGALKVFITGLDRFLQDVGNYRMVGEPWDAVVAVGVPWLEIAVGMCLILGLLRRGAILVTGGLVAVFSAAVGWAWLKGLDISCGCHGGDAPIRYWAKAAEFAGYYAVLGFLWWVEGRGSGSQALLSDEPGAEAIGRES